LNHVGAPAEDGPPDSSNARRAALPMVSGDEIATVSGSLKCAKNREKSAISLLNATLMHRRNLDAFTFDSSHRLKRDSNFTRTNMPARSQIGQGKTALDMRRPARGNWGGHNGALRSE
jgi:hypothetical protein